MVFFHLSLSVSVEHRRSVLFPHTLESRTALGEETLQAVSCAGRWVPPVQLLYFSSWATENCTERC